jgi:hypothetical protein
MPPAHPFAVIAVGLRLVVGDADGSPVATIRQNPPRRPQARYWYHELCHRKRRDDAVESGTAQGSVCVGRVEGPANDLKCYQRADPVTMRRALATRMRLEALSNRDTNRDKLLPDPRSLDPAATAKSLRGHAFQTNGPGRS